MHRRSAGQRTLRLVELPHLDYLTLDHGHAAPLLPLYEGLGRVMLLTRACGGAREVDVRRADEAGRKGDREAAAWLAEMRTEADRLVAQAEVAYAATRPPKGQGRGGRDGDGERRGYFAGRTDEAGWVVFATPSAKAVGGRR
jgi:hypothetical protein